MIVSKEFIQRTFILLKHLKYRISHGNIDSNGFRSHTLSLSRSHSHIEMDKKMLFQLNHMNRQPLVRILKTKMPILFSLSHTHCAAAELFGWSVCFVLFQIISFYCISVLICFDARLCSSAFVHYVNCKLNMCLWLLCTRCASLYTQQMYIR